MFIASLEGGSSVSQACERAKIGRMTAYDHRARDEEFAQRWDDALEAGADALEQEAKARAMDRDDPASGRLLQFLLKGYRRSTFGDKVEVDARVEAVTSREMAAIQAIADADPEAWERVAAAAAKALPEVA